MIAYGFHKNSLWGKDSGKDSVCLVCEQKETKYAAFQRENESLSSSTVFNEAVFFKRTPLQGLPLPCLCHKYHKIQGTKPCIKKQLMAISFPAWLMVFSKSSVDRNTSWRTFKQLRVIVKLSFLVSCPSLRAV